MNKIILIGNLTKTPELNELPSGKNCAKFTIAVQRPFANADGEKEADFINCIAWGKQGENLAKYCEKGSKIAVAGALQTRTYENKNGEKRYVTEVVADSIEFLTSVEKKADKPANKKLSDLKATEADDFPF